MALIRPKVLLRKGRINQPIRVSLLDLTLDATRTYLTGNTNAGVSTLTVKGITGFAINQILLLGNPGDAGSEIIKTHASTAPTGSTVTLASATTQPHSGSTAVYIINYDQVEISNAATLTGSKSVLSTVSIDPTSDTTNYYDAANNTGYYFARFKNTIGSTFSTYSDGAIYSGYTQLSARSIIDSALGEIGKTQTETLTDEFCFQQIDNCQTEVIREQKRWSFMQLFNQIIGETSTGNWKVAVPAMLDDQNTPKSIYNVRIGRNPDLQWVDKEKFDDITSNVSNTTLASNIIVGATTATLTSSGDFGDSGSFTCGANTYSFTANNRTTDVLTLTSASTTTNTAGDDVFQYAALGNPQWWTIYGGYIYFYPACGAAFTQRNIYMDFYIKQVPVTSDSQEIVLPDPTIINYYLQWKLLKRLNNGDDTEGSLSCMNLYMNRREKLKQKDSLGRTFAFKPLKNSLYNRQPFAPDDKATRLGNYTDA